MRSNKSNFYYNIESENNIIEPFTLDDLFSGPMGNTGLRGVEGNIGTVGFKGQKRR